MAAITPREGSSFDSAAFYQHVAKFLPNYARPRFIRVQVSVPAFKIVPPPPPAVTSGTLVVSGLAGRDGHLQVPEDGAGEGGLRPQPRGPPALLPGRAAAGLRAADAGDLRLGRLGEDQNLEEASAIARYPTRHFRSRTLHSEHSGCFKLDF